MEQRSHEPSFEVAFDRELPLNARICGHSARCAGGAGSYERLVLQPEELVNLRRRQSAIASISSRLERLVLDDPVQSMDDVHIAQFAALLRSFSKGLGKQVVIAVHERALFEYLTLELSPGFAGDSLITVEISRNFAGDIVADPRFYAFEDDKAVAA